MTLRAWQRWTLWGAGLAVATLIMLAYRDRLDKAHVALIYLVVVLLGTVGGGRRLGLSIAGTAFLLFDWFFLRPFGTLSVANPLDWSVLVVFVAVSAVAAQLLHRLQREALVAQQRAEEVNQFAALGAETLNVARADEALHAVAETIRINLRLESCTVHTGGAGDPLVGWVRQNGCAALRLADGTTHLAAGAEAPEHLPAGAAAVAWLLPLGVRGQVVGVLEVGDPRGIDLGHAERRFLRALRYYAALGIERARLVAEAERADALRAADRLKDALLASVSHDLRTPLTTIKALAHEIGPRDERAQLIEEEADRLNRLVADLLDLSRLHAGAIPLNVTLNAAEDLVGALVQRVSGALGGRQLDIAFDDASTLLVGRFDLVHALRILVNLVENAHKYSPPGTPLTLRVWRDGEWLQFSIADRGPGVDEAERERIFAPFYRPAGAIADGRSAGLGLSIARGLAALQGGTLHYVARAGGGSEFVLALPAADLPADALES